MCLFDEHVLSRNSLPLYAVGCVLKDMVTVEAMESAEVPIGQKSLAACQYHRFLLNARDTTVNGPQPLEHSAMLLGTDVSSSAAALTEFLTVAENGEHFLLYPGAPWTVPSADVVAQVNYDLGRHRFLAGDYAAAQNFFDRAAETLSTCDSRCGVPETATSVGEKAMLVTYGASAAHIGYVSFKSDSLAGFRRACDVFRSVVTQPLSSSTTIKGRSAAAAIHKVVWSVSDATFEELSDLFRVDNTTRKIPLQTRLLVARRAAENDAVSSATVLKVKLLNCIRAAVDGEVNPLPHGAQGLYGDFFKDCAAAAIDATPAVVARLGVLVSSAIATTPASRPEAETQCPALCPPIEQFPATSSPSDCGIPGSVIPSRSHGVASFGLKLLAAQDPVATVAAVARGPTAAVPENEYHWAFINNRVTELSDESKVEILVNSAAAARGAGPSGALHSAMFVKGLRGTFGTVNGGIHAEELLAHSTLHQAGYSGTAIDAPSDHLLNLISATVLPHGAVLEHCAATLLNAGAWSTLQFHVRKWSTAIPEHRGSYELIGIVATASNATASANAPPTATMGGSTVELSRGSCSAATLLCTSLVRALNTAVTTLQPGSSVVSGKRKRTESDDSPCTSADARIPPWYRPLSPALGPCAGSLWEQLARILDLVSNVAVLLSVAAALAVVYNRIQEEKTHRISVSQFGPCADLLREAAQSVDPKGTNAATVRAGLLRVVEIGAALPTNQGHPSFLFILADLHHLKALSLDAQSSARSADRFEDRRQQDVRALAEEAVGSHRHAVRGYLAAFAAVTSSFNRSLLTQRYLHPRTIDRLAVSLLSVGAELQAAAVMQYGSPIKYDEAFRAINSACRVRCNGMLRAPPTAYLRYFWDLTMLEMLLSLHSAIGETTLLIQLIGRPEFNDSSDAKSRAVEVAKNQLLHALAVEFSAV